MKKTIRYLKITNYKSIRTLEIKGLSSFSVFAGANGSGKSNFFDALEFVSIFLHSGIETAIREHGGYQNIHSQKLYKEEAKTFRFEIECELPDVQDDKTQRYSTYKYTLVVYRLDGEPLIEETLKRNDKYLLKRKKDSVPVLIINEKNEFELENHPRTHSALLFHMNTPLPALLLSLNMYRIDPNGTKVSDKSNSSSSVLKKEGHNLASVLRRIENNSKKREAILEMMAIVVPGLEKITTEEHRLEQKTSILFKEQGTTKKFPAHMVSDGTVYALSLLVALLDLPSNSGITLIEEPERGLHPTAIRELIALAREQASPANPIWLTTHSESVVRELKLEELILVDKVEGKTKMKAADSGNLTEDDIKPLGLDKVWLSNLLNGGVPW